ncbi:MAG: sugar ABC transporter substrate-binding protein, partial [Roseibium sp.]|nr:sugar ABC transporter substrate-binding protein [Roseibium sp.]
MKKTLIAMAAAAVAFTGLTAPSYAEGERFVLISHAPDSDSWWN